MTGQMIKVCKADDVSPGNQKIVDVNGMSVGIFNIDGGYYALLNICPHRGAALCEGPQCGTTQKTNDYEFIYGEKDAVVRCSWHGWEFDIRSGAFLADNKIKAKTFEVSVSDNDVFVHI